MAIVPKYPPTYNTSASQTTKLHSPNKPSYGMQKRPTSKTTSTNSSSTTRKEEPSFSCRFQGHSRTSRRNSCSEFLHTLLPKKDCQNGVKPSPGCTSSNAFTLLSPISWPKYKSSNPSTSKASAHPFCLISSGCSETSMDTTSKPSNKTLSPSEKSVCPRNTNILLA